ncbi:MAG: Gfo/Idh/MocA family oxidoreductase [Armatimonadetes bacterium]|nr:Gfo/Idh/MocA family oxidoreductase [Armatimonadota bacterium]
MASLGIGIIGTGRIAHQHLRSLKDFAPGRVVSVMDVLQDRAEAVAAEFGIPNIDTSVEGLLQRPEVGAVIVSTPPVAHHGPVMAALEAGKHVLCEKPFSLNLDEAKEMTAKAEAVGRHLAVCSARFRCSKAAQEAYQRVQTGELGTVYHIRSSSFRQRGRPGLDFWPDAPWFLDKSKAGGGTLMDLGVYQIDQMMWYLGYPKVKSVTATTFHGVGKSAPEGVTYDVEDHANVMIVTEGGASAFLEIGWSTNMSGASGLFIWGDKAGLKFDPLTMISEPLEENKLTETALLGDEEKGPGPYGDVTQQFVRAVVEGREPWTPAREALVVTQIMDAAYRSAESGGSVELF